MINRIKKLIVNEHGLTSIEPVVLMLFIVVMVGTGTIVFGKKVWCLFEIIEGICP